MIDPRSPNYDSTPISADRPLMAYAPDGAAAPPQVTVVTPLFNTGEVFHETAACLLGFDAREPDRRRCSGQSLQNFRWIIVNDASTSRESLAILDQYRALARRDSRIRVIDHAANHGLPASRNTGWRAATTPYVFFLDSDDLIEPTTLEKSALHLACNPEFAFVGGYTVGFAAQQYLWTRGFHERASMLEQNLVTATTMVRTAVLAEVGGFDESIRGGMEDWEFWLRAAALGPGHWGDTIPEHLDWYRRRDNQHAAWVNIQRDDRRTQFLGKIRAAHPAIFDGRFPAPARAWHMPFTHPPERTGGAAPADSWLSAGDLASNPLAKGSQRLLMVVPWLRMGGADRFNLDLIRYLTTRAQPRWEVTVATTLPGHPWLPEFAALTPDIFCLDHLSRLPHVPRLLDHLIASRRPDVVMVSNSQLGYFLLPYLRSRHPDTTFIDLNHMEEPQWQNGGHSRTGTGFQEQLDLSIVVSGHLKRWMAAPPRCADPDRIEVCHINADTTTFRPNPETRATTRTALGIDARTPVLLYAARLCAQKQPLVFARTIELLAQSSRSNSFLALVAGEGELQPALAEFIRDHNLSERVRLLGPVPAAQMPALFAASDIFFLPSQWEGIALSIYEAMAAGLCVVGADVGGQTELVTPESGVLLPFPTRDPELEACAYSQVLGSLLADPARIRALGDAARARATEHFDLSAMGRRMLSLFERAHELRRTHPRRTISPALARELALQGVEMMRIHELAEELWPFRVRAEEIARAAVAAEDAEAARNAEAALSLAHLETSAAWRAVQSLKRTPPYRLLARIRYGPNWDLVDPKESPAARLQRLVRTRSFRFTRALERFRGR